MIKILRHTFLITTLAFATVSSQAATTLFNVTWSGSGATASGTVGIDTSMLPNPGSYPSSIAMPSWLTSVSLDVSGTAGGSGDGHFTLTDFSGVDWAANSTLDLNSELVGQSGFADFSLVRNSSSTTAPSGNGTTPLTMVAGGTGGETMTLQSMTAAPEPTRALLLLGGLAGFAFRRRRRQVA